MINLPNLLALFRIILAPLFFFILLYVKFYDISIDITWINYFAALIFVVASITDFFDGYIARQWKQKTTLGAILDPLADKMITLAGFLGLMLINRADPWAIYLILVREFFITGFRSVMISQNINVSASFCGKIKTVAQMFAIGFLTMQWYGGKLLLWISVFLTIYSGFKYIFDYVKILKEREKNAKK